MASNTLVVKFAELDEALRAEVIPTPKIQTVAGYLRNRKRFVKQYSPKSVSIGPIHHDDQNLKLGEDFKLISAAKYNHITGQYDNIGYKKIANNIDKIKGLYADYVLANTEKSLEGFNSLDEKLSWILFMDGCFLLYIMLFVNVDPLYGPHEQDQLNISVDPASTELVTISEHLKTKADQLVLVMRDVLLLENQLPFLVLKLLWHGEDETTLIRTMEKFLKGYNVTTPDNDTTLWGPDIQKKLLDEPKPTHLLDLQRKILLLATKEQSGEYSEEEEGKVITYRKIEDLTAVGINLQSSGRRWTKDIDFWDGWFNAKLILPEIVVDDTTAVSFLNLVAYELCPDFKNDYGISTFLSFISSLIDGAEDVKKLRSEGILLNLLGSDQDVVDLFNIISEGLVPKQTTYYGIRAKIEKHHAKKGKIWIAQGIHIYLSNPWAITGVLAAFTALALTFVQTWFTVYPH
ncbi:UPF0481 protein At3g47200-like [Vicia villosa]|uniref:UPF0481 protein At3g47200-like n=1 Tax=Vicia villosa TaxID=3911 RepID=UPI00273C4E41|nr:UPF0481 protein At3g47200-like [Vicia villosa]